jgi:hypothetical protein
MLYQRWRALNVRQLRVCMRGVGSPPEVMALGVS